VCPSLSHGAAVSDSSAAPSSSRVMSHAMFIPEGLGASLGVVLFCFSGHATFPDLYAQMKPSDRPHFGTSVIMGFSFAGAFYGFTSPLPRSATWHMARKSGSNPQHLWCWLLLLLGCDGIVASLSCCAFEPGAAGTCAADALTLNLMASSPVLGRLATVTVLTSTFTIIPIQSLICVKSLETIKATLLEIAASLCDSRTKRHAVPPNDLLEVLSK
jgi:hypothetical protein